MNETVKRIVEILFQDTEMTDEVASIKDEVMNNCQERYADLVARGMTEDEAIGEVVESLKGMEEVIGEFPKVLIVIFGSLACIVVNVQAGLSTVEKTFLDVATVFNATPAQRLFNVAIPASLDAIFAGVRTSTSAAWMVVLAAEMLGANAGVGFLISRGMDSIDMPLVLTGMLAIGIVGALLAIITQFAERLICPWTRKKR
jgi:ABC-type proline/glycine betaine transport system permease subunit